MAIPPVGFVDFASVVRTRLDVHGDRHRAFPPPSLLRVCRDLSDLFCAVSFGSFFLFSFSLLFFFFVGRKRHGSENSNAVWLLLCRLAEE